MSSSIVTDVLPLVSTAAHASSRPYGPKSLHQSAAYEARATPTSVVGVLAVAAAVGDDSDLAGGVLGPRRS